MSNTFYGVEWDDDCDWDEQYDMLRGPDGFECLLTEPEDRIWLRDGKPVVKKLNEQADTIVSLTARLAEAEAANQSLQTQSQKAFDFLYELNEWVVSRKKGIAMAETEKKPMTREEMQNRLDWLEPCLNDGDAGRFFTMEQLVAMDSERKQLRERLAEAAKGQQDGD